jgi:hypothetical protein
MEPIISPWIIYAISVLSSVKFILMLGCVVSSIVWGMSIILNEEDGAKILFKYSSIAFIVCIMPTILIPSKETMLTMLTLHYVTPDNLSLVQNNVVEFIQEIVEALKGVNL